MLKRQGGDIPQESIPPFSRDIWLLACEYQARTRQHQELLSRFSNMIPMLVPLGIPVLPTPSFTLPYSTHPSLPQNVSTFILNSVSPQTKSTPLTTFTRPEFLTGVSQQWGALTALPEVWSPMVRACAHAHTHTHIHSQYAWVNLTTVFNSNVRRSNTFF